MMAMFLAMITFTLTLFSDTVSAAGADLITTGDQLAEGLLFTKNVFIWFMLMMVAFLMIFIRKFEWGVALAVLLSAACSFIAYMAIQDFYFDEAWNQTLMIRGSICAITVVIAIGVFLGTVKMWQYMLVGFAFAPAYALIEWVMGNVEVLGGFATDPGGSMLVHMCAAYFGLGVAIAIRSKEAFKEPMYTTTHSVTFVWLASMVLWVLWPAFVSSLVPMDHVAWATITCYMAGVGSILSTYAICQILQKKVNPLIYTYAMLAGPVAIGSPLLSVGPWEALLIGIVAGAVSALAFIYLQPWLCGKLGVLDVMGVHNLHGIGGWVGVFASVIVLGSIVNLGMALVVLVIALCTGAVTGLIVRFTRGDMPVMFDDDTDFIKNEETS